MRSLSERVKECITIRCKMNELGISGLDSIMEYNDIMNNYIRTGESKSGVIMIPANKTRPSLSNNATE